VLGRRGEGHGEWRGELTDGPFALREGAEHAAARGVAEGAEDGVEGDGILFNHVVEYQAATGNCQPHGLMFFRAGDRRSRA
jgi:hypothetical protein